MIRCIGRAYRHSVFVGCVLVGCVNRVCASTTIPCQSQEKVRHVVGARNKRILLRFKKIRNKVDQFLVSFVHASQDLFRLGFHDRVDGLVASHFRDGLVDTVDAVDLHGLGKVGAEVENSEFPVGGLIKWVDGGC